MPISNLVVVAHPDDEILGFGATGAKLAARGEIVRAVILCGAADQRNQRPSDEDLQADIIRASRSAGFAAPVLGHFPNIRLNTVDHISLVAFIEEQIKGFQPQRIFTHHPMDLNDDHVQVSKACMAASRLFQRIPGIAPLESLHFMEVLSSTDWAFPSGGPAFQPNTFVEIGEYLDRKLEALACYREVMRDFPHPRSVEVIRGLAAYRGGQSGRLFAEAFQTVFQVGLT